MHQNQILQLRAAALKPAAREGCARLLLWLLMNEWGETKLDIRHYRIRWNAIKVNQSRIAAGIRALYEGDEENEEEAGEARRQMLWKRSQSVVEDEEELSACSLSSNIILSTRL